MCRFPSPCWSPKKILYTRSRFFLSHLVSSELRRHALYPVLLKGCTDTNNSTTVLKKMISSPPVFFLLGHAVCRGTFSVLRALRYKRFKCYFECTQKAWGWSVLTVSTNATTDSHDSDGRYTRKNSTGLPRTACTSGTKKQQPGPRTTQAGTGKPNGKRKRARGSWEGKKDLIETKLEKIIIKLS